MKTGFLFSWTAVLAVGLASAQTPGSSPAPAGQPPAGGQGAAAAPSANGQPAGQAGAAAPATPAGVQGAWDDSGNGTGGRCGLLCGRPWSTKGDVCVDGCLQNNRWWVEGEYLLWRVHDSTPAEITGLFIGTGTNPSTGLDSTNARSGFRVTAGMWFDETHCGGFEASFFFLDQKRGWGATGTQDVGLNGTSMIPPRVILNLPIDPQGDLDPGDLLTSVLNGSSYFRLWGIEANLRRTVWWFGGFTCDILAGFRQMNLDETVSLGGDFTFSEPSPDEATPGPEDGRTVHMSTVDTVQTHDQFYGGQVGASFCWHWYRVTLDGTAKFAVGGTSQQITNGGQTMVSPGLIEPSPGAGFLFRPAATLPGGLISSTPLTTTNRTRISVLPELRADLGYQLTPNLRAYIGYNFIWWTNVAIVGDQSSVTTTGTRDIWFQGLDAGFQLRF